MRRDSWAGAITLRETVNTNFLWGVVITSVVSMFVMMRRLLPVAPDFPVSVWLFFI